MKPVLIAAGVLLALFVAVTVVANVKRGASEASVGDLVVARTFSGKLIDTHGKPFPNARIYLHAALGHPEKRGQDRASMPMQHTEADGEGNFAFSGVAPGTYSMQVYWQDTSDKGNFYSDAQKFWIAVDPASATADLTVVALALSGQSVSGTVTDAQGRPASGVSVEAKGYADFSRSSATTGSDGSYTVRGIAGDRASTIWFKGAGNAELKDIAVGRADADATLR